MNIESELFKSPFNIDKKEDISEKNKKLQNVLTICYNKKWLILLVILIVLLILYIYFYNINIPTFCIPVNTKYNIFSNTNKKKNSCDDIVELQDKDDWNLENEMQEFIELQDNYIQLSDN